MELKDIQKVYFLGIGGIGMSALARYFHFLGKEVAGFDKTATKLTKELEALQMFITYEDNVQQIPEKFLNKNNTLVVYTPAIPKQHPQLVYFQENQFELQKRSEVLGTITKGTYSFAVAGTHGKTTTTAILGHLLYQAQADVTCFVGGILEQYQTNLLGNGKTISVVEADEFDRSFLRLQPNMACVTSMDADHLDIYQTKENFEQAFQHFAAKVTEKDSLLVAEQVPLKGLKVGFEPTSDFYIHHIEVKDGYQWFDFKTPKGILKQLAFPLPGKHNLMNAAMAVGMCLQYGIEEDIIKKALANFAGVQRRFSFPIRTKNLVMIDDYAHHPTEINAVTQALQMWFPDKIKTVVFQPHLFSRTRDFMEDFAKALSVFDQVILLDIYPARELPIEGITSEALLQLISNPNKQLIAKNDLISFLQKQKLEVLAILGAGDIGEMVADIANELMNHKNE
jgi:UDP-N-acetylmuramate--alanine ligase